MDFDISKLGAGRNKAGEGKAKPRFGPAVRARPKPAAKPAEAPATDEPLVKPNPSGAVTDSAEQGHANNELPESVSPHEPALPSAAGSGLQTSQPAPQPVTALLTQPAKEVRRPAAGKRKAVEAVEAAPEAMPEAGPEGEPAQDAGAERPAGNGLDVTSMDNSPEAASADTGPMTKAKKRKGMGKGAAEARKPKAPLAELKIDVQTMNMKTVIKCANAKDRAKSNAAQLAKDAAAIGQGGASSSGRQQAPPPPDPDPDSLGAPQMIVDPETGKLVLDKASLTVQAQPREEYVRREEGHHDLVNSQTYLRRCATNKWSPEETDEFWAGLAIFGDMPCMIATRLNMRLANLGAVNIVRTSRHIKNKIKKERTKNPRRVDAVILNQHAQPEDYAEVQEGLNPNQVNEDEYLEAAPEGEGHQESANSGVQSTSQAVEAPAAVQPALPAAQVQVQTGAQAKPSAGKGPRARPHAATRPRAVKADQQVNPKADQQQQQQQIAPDDSQTRYLRMLQETGVTPEEMEEAY